MLQGIRYSNYVILSHSICMINLLKEKLEKLKKSLFKKKKKKPCVSGIKLKYFWKITWVKLTFIIKLRTSVKPKWEISANYWYRKILGKDVRTSRVC